MCKSYHNQWRWELSQSYISKSLIYQTSAADFLEDCVRMDNINNKVLNRVTHPRRAFPVPFKLGTFADANHEILGR